MIRLFINLIEVDLNQDTADVTLSFSVEDIVPGKISGARSKRTLSAPATDKNINIFEHVEIPGSTTTNAYKLLPARLESNGLPILTGKARLDSVSINQNELGFSPTQYKIALIGDNADWFTDVGNQLVRNLNWGLITVSVSQIEQNRDPLSSSFAWILMKWKAWIAQDKVKHSEFTPAIFIWKILDNAFAAHGYKLESIFKTDPFNRLVIPVGLNLDANFFVDFVNLRASTASPKTFIVAVLDYGERKISFTNETTSPNFDNGKNYTNGTYTAPITALYDIIFELNINVVATSGDPAAYNQLELYIKVNGVVASIFGLAEGHDWNTSFVFNDSITFEFITALKKGDTVELYVVYQGVTLTMNNIDGSISIEAEKDSFEIGETYQLSYLIPSSWYVKDIINDLTFLYNLAWETDVQGKTVYAYPKDDYYLRYRANATGAPISSGFGGFFQNLNQYDLQGRTIQGSELKIIDNYTQNEVLTFATDDDTTNAEERRRGVNIYSGGFQFPSDRFPDGVNFLYTNFFAKTIHINDSDITSGGMFGAQIPLLFGADYNTTDKADPNYYLAPRLLYYAGRRSGKDGYVRLYNSTTSATSAFDFPAAFMVNYNDPSGADFSLSFSDEVTNYSNVIQGNFKNFYLQEFKRREIGKIFTTFTKFDQSEITNLSFRRKAKIGTSNFIIQNVEYNPRSNNPSKIVLLYDERPNTTDLLKVINTVTLAGAGGQPGTITGSGSGLVGAATSTVNIYLSRTIFKESTTNILVLPANSGIVNVSNTLANVFVFMNGQKILEGDQYSISGSTITINSLLHYNGATYEIIINGVTKS